MKFPHLVLAAVLAAAMPAMSAGASSSGVQQSQDRDLAAVMKVVKRPGQTARASSSRQQSSSRRSAKPRNRYLKMEFGDSGGEELSISVPFSLVELVASFDEETTLNDVGADSDIKLKDVIEALRDLGPGELLEVRGDDGWFRLWLE